MKKNNKNKKENKRENNQKKIHTYGGEGGDRTNQNITSRQRSRQGRQINGTTFSLHVGPNQDVILVI